MYDKDKSLGYIKILNVISFVDFSGDKANAVPHTNKLRTRVNHIWVNRRRQLNRSAMEEPLPKKKKLFVVFPWIETSTGP